MRGFFAQILLAFFVVPGFTSVFFLGNRAGDLMQKDAVIDADAHVAEQGARPEAAGVGNGIELTCRGFVKRRISPREPGGTQQGGNQAAVLKDENTLLQLIDDKADVLGDFLRFQPAGLDVTGKAGGKDANPAALLYK